MASPETKNNGAFPFWEWIQGVFSPQSGAADSLSDRPPPKRGLAITVCILVSAFLWFTFTIRGVYTATITFPTVVQNLPDDEALVSLPPENIRVQVEGEGFALIRLNYNPPTVPIDASTDVVGIEETVRRLPQGVRITNVSPTTFNLRKERRITRTVPVLSRVDIRTPSTHDLLEPPSFTPDSVRVTGAFSIVNSLEFWPTEERVFRDVRDSISSVVPLADTLNGLVQRSVQSTLVEAQSRQFTEGMREIPVNIIGGPERAVTLDPSSIRVRYRVLFSQYQDALEAPDFFSTVSFEDVLTDTTGRVRPTEERVFRDVRDSISSVVPLADTLNGLVQRSVQSTLVEAQSRQFTEGMREIPVNIIGGPERAVTLDPSSIRVRYRVLFSQYQDALEAPDFFSTVSFEDVLTDTTGRVRPTLHLPTDIVLRDIEMIPPILRYFQRLD